MEIFAKIVNCFPKLTVFFSSIEEINRLISKGMSNRHLKVTIDKN